MTWFAFKNDGHVYDLNGLAEKELTATFAHGYATEAEALTKPNAPASADQAVLLASFVTAASSPVGGGAQGVLQVIDVNAQGKQTGTVGPLSNPVTSGLGSLLGIGNVSGTNLVIRAVKVIIGGVLLIVGLVHITGADSNAIASAARKVPLPV